MEEVEKDKEKLEEEIEMLRRKLTGSNEEMSEKINYYQNELSKHQNLLYKAQEKAQVFEKRSSELEDELKTADLNSTEFQRKFLSELEKNRKYPEIIATKELELNEVRSIFTTSQQLIGDKLCATKSSVDIVLDHLFFWECGVT